MKKVKMVVLLAATLVGALAFGETYTDGDLVWTYTAKSGAATLSGVARKDGGTLTGALVIPSTVNGVNVTAIAENSFVDLQITSLSFAEGVKTINTGAFANCTALETLTLPDSLTTLDGCSGYSYMDGAFSGCTQLSDVRLPAALTAICGAPFAGCSPELKVIAPEGSYAAAWLAENK